MNSAQRHRDPPALIAIICLALRDHAARAIDFAD
jgi:hypothetical protein